MLILDTGPLYAVLDRADAHHEACVALLEATPERLVAPAPVVAEVAWLALNHLGAGAQTAFIKSVAHGELAVADLTRADYKRVHELLDIYEDFPLDLADAAVVAVAEREGETTIATTDHRHFRVLRPAHAESFVLVP